MDLDAFSMWMYSNSYAQSTIKGRINLLRGIEKMGKDLDSMKDLDIAKFVHDLNRTDSAKNNLAKAINLYLRFTGREFKLKLKRKTGNMDIWIPSKEEKERILSVEWGNTAVTAKKRLLLRILFETATRSDEVRKLRYSDVRKRKRKNVIFYYINVTGKGNKERQVPISDQLYHDIMEFKRWYSGPTDYILINPKTGKPLSNAWIRKVCSEAGRMAGVSQFHTHAARHYRAVELYEEDVKLEVIRKFLGHSRLETVKTYLMGASDALLWNELIEKDTYFISRRKQEVRF